jgi:hypothetical protein
VVNVVHKKKRTRERLDFPLDPTLKTRIAIYVPSTYDGVHPIGKLKFAKRVGETQKFLNNIFGGSTRIRGQGSYTMKGGKLIKEDVAVVEAFTEPRKWFAKDLKVKKWIEDKRNEWKQQAVSFEYEAPQRPASSLTFV